MRAGQALFGADRPHDAIKHFVAASRIAPKVASCRANLGICLEECGRHDEALEAIGYALDTDASLAPCHQSRGRVLVALGRLQEASRAFARALDSRRDTETLNDFANLLRIQCRFPLDALPPAQREEIETTLRALEVHDDLDGCIADAVASADVARLEHILRGMPPDRLEIDSAVMARIERYADSARTLAAGLGLEIVRPLPDTWLEIEALFMVPVVETPADYARYVTTHAPFGHPEGDWRESLSMTAALDAMRVMPVGPDDPIRAETCLRYWHALACRDLEGFLPGHFKITKNRADNPSVVRARPDRVTGSTRELLGKVAASVPDGLPRALLLLIGLLDIHPFADGNWRVAHGMMNRELERRGLMPAIHEPDGIEGPDAKRPRRGPGPGRRSRALGRGRCRRHGLRAELRPGPGRLVNMSGRTDALRFPT